LSPDERDAFLDSHEVTEKFLGFMKSR